MTVETKQRSRQVITEIVGSFAVKLNWVGELNVDQDLGNIGLKSFDLVRLMLAVEDAFNLEFPPHVMTSENFRSVRTIESLVESIGG
jgi:acyl carrier protein